jgi:hypothetical protein
MTFDERVHAVEQKGFTERQARFLTTVMLHAGVCVPRQYARFCRIVYGAKTRKFFDKLVRLRYASMYDCRHNRARIYHVNQRALYAAIGEAESRAVPADILQFSARVVVSAAARLDVGGRPANVFEVERRERRTENSSACRPRAAASDAMTIDSGSSSNALATCPSLWSSVSRGRRRAGGSVRRRRSW